MSKLEFSVNGRACTVEVHPMKRLLDVVRDDLGLHGAKEGCGEGECGACAVEVDGRLVVSCLVPVGQCAGARVRTVEGLAPDAATLSKVQQAFLQYGGAQCGICTPGMLMAATALLDKVPRPSEADVRTALAGNLCRCTGYMKIFEAVVRALESA
ncbi:MAG: (2Fe-2S)-binding protein [Deltaproteobacteria bacterium]|nr:(2Fe-2S)-binding protein [Deltaproteobacteria bacterium]